MLANAGFGTVVSESGSGYTWAENAHEFRLTTWKNDPVSNPTAEAYYVRDDESGRFWSPTAATSLARRRTRFGARYYMGISHMSV